MLRISSSSGCDTGDEWFPNRDEAAEGPTEETKGGQPTVLDFSSCLHSYSNALVEKQKKTTVFFFVWTYSFLDFSSFFERKTKEETKYARYARGPLSPSTLYADRISCYTFIKEDRTIFAEDSPLV